MTRPYRRPTLHGWLLPALVGTPLSVYATVTALAVLWGDAGVVWRGVGWALGMVFGTVWLFVYLLLVLLSDLALLAVKVRTLPTGGRAWGAALVAPPIVALVYKLFPPYQFYASGPWAVVLAFLLPMVVAAAAGRVLAGARPLR